ncbi:MAG: hypothetical protein LBV00_03055 [Propionibacteriaceae bacterium]|jgi:hypothetical protein|nr:hypothetical protein [Propionibacteriaceae bacterium]
MPDPHNQHPGQAVTRETEPQQPRAEPSALACHGDPSVQRRKTDGRHVSPDAKRRGGIEWVRASDLLTRGGIRLGDKGVAAQEATVRRLRRGMASINPVTRSGIARRSAAALPPPSVFGQTVYLQGQAVTR